MEILLIGLLYIGLALGAFILFGLPWLWNKVIVPASTYLWTHLLQPLFSGIYYWTVGD